MKLSLRAQVLLVAFSALAVLGWAVAAAYIIGPATALQLNNNQRSPGQVVAGAPCCPDDCPCMRLETMWHVFMADVGNAPGTNQGDVVVTMMEPVGGVQEVTVPSADVSIAAEAGNLIGVQVMMPGGRHLFIGANNLAGIIDAPVAEDKPARASRAAAR